MYAVSMSRRATPEEDAMPANEDSRDTPSQLAELRADVRHLQADVTDLKTEVRTNNQRIDALNDKFDKKIDALGERLDMKIDALGDKFYKAFDDLREKNNDKMTTLLLRIEDVSKSVGSAKLWAILVFCGIVASLLSVIAHGLKWL